jgi:putative aldouronate transport system permease protein
VVGGRRMKIITRNIKLNNKGDWLFDSLNNIILGLVFLVVTYPLYFVVIASFSNPYKVNSGDVLFLPKDFTLEGYTRILENSNIWTGYFNTTLYTIFGTVFGITLTMMIAYSLSRKVFAGKNGLMIFLVITMYFHGGLIPTYLLIKGLGLLNTRLVMLLVGSVGVFNIILARTFLSSTLPEELFEAASLDGCNHIRYFFTIALPLSKAIMAVLALYYGIGHWNDYFKGLIYLNDSKLYPLQLFLRSILIENEVDNTVMDMEEVLNQQRIVEIIKYGLIIISSLPILMLYPFLQKYFVQGVMIGSIKG